jgi:hypothetical protein
MLREQNRDVTGIGRGTLLLDPIATSALALVSASPTVTIPAGTLHGATCSNGANAFLSVPFAVPPVGSL